MITFTIPANFLLALSVFAPQKEVRYYLKGVCFSCRDNKLSMVATNGAALGCIDKFTIGLPDFEFIVSNETIKMLSVFKNKDITFIIKDSIFTANGLPFTPIDAKYPDFNRVLHVNDREYSNIAANIDFELLALFSKCAKTLGNSKFCGNWHLKYDGEFSSVGVYAVGATKTILEDNLSTWRGVVMPVRS